jgi:hypothetical protein
MKELIKKTLLWTLFRMLILIISLVFGYNIYSANIILNRIGN